ncbi:hypothetical protein [Desertivibrio insolitus]|uniref:hypothetical protein n=1 Tax=Herbiconiux sp. SYSU D00978 TaxID=2812562 RepID=UPI001A9677CC|nr:hypothetical protein [Herbiconiux sp. SYSU D00978]
MSNPNFDSETPFQDRVQADDLEKTIATNDAVAGETILDGPGDGNDGPTGGAEKEFTPDYPENDLEGQDIDLDETPPAGE